MSVSTSMKKFGLEQAFNYLYKEPEKNMRKLFSWAEKYGGKMYPHQLEQVKDAIENPKNPYYRYIRHLIGDVDQEVLKTVAVNFFINENMIGWPKQQELKEKYNCNIPWTILLDPTSACNLHCTGCWAAEYGNKLNLSFDEIDDIIPLPSSRCSADCRRRWGPAGSSRECCSCIFPSVRIASASRSCFH